MSTTTTTTAAPASNSTSASPSSPHLAELQSTGYTIIRSLLSTEELSTLRAAAAESTAQARAGKWPFIRTLPKQFPPWPSQPGPEGIWGVQHLLHPSQPGHDTYLRSYFHPRLLSVVEEILGVTSANASDNSTAKAAATFEATDSEPLVMELYNLLVRPDSNFDLRWHRDDIPPSASAAAEESALGIRDAAGNPCPKPATYSHTQWNLALYPDASLIVVPGTHKRARTSTERDAGPYDRLPGELAVQLHPGDVVLYDNDILHRGAYDATKERATLHGSVGKSGFAERRARNVLQHGVGEWIGGCGMEGLERGVRARAEGMKGNLIAMGGGGAKGFSQVD